MPTGSICLVANDLEYFVRNGGVGTYFWSAAHMFADAGWRTHLIYCGQPPSPQLQQQVTDRLRAARIELTCIDPHIPKANRGATPDAVARWANSWSHLLRVSDMVCDTIRHLHAMRPIDLVEFGDWQGIGFRTIQARRTGALPPSLGTIVRMHGSTEWNRRYNGLWSAGGADRVWDYSERYSVEHCDFPLSQTGVMLRAVAKGGWRTTAEARVIPYPLPEAAGTCTTDGRVDEVVFFGRLESRKGFEVFTDAIARLRPSVAVTFLGRVGTLECGLSPQDYVARKLGDRKVRFETNLGREEALRYLRSRRCLAVVASHSETYGFTVVECATNGIPFVVASYEALAEVIADDTLRDAHTFQPNALALADKLKVVLSEPADQVLRRAREMMRHFAIGPHNASVELAYRGMLAEHRESVARRRFSDVVERPKVSVWVTNHNRHAYLSDALESLTRQDYPHRQVAVIDDGSTSPEAADALRDLASRFPDVSFRFETHEGVVSARSHALAATDTELFLPFDAGSIAKPAMLSTLVRALESTPSLSAVSSPFRTFADKHDLTHDTAPFAFNPPGGPFIEGAIRNVFGDATAIFRTRDLRAAGGYPDNPAISSDAWIAYVRLVQAGFCIDLVPEILFYCRVRGDSPPRTSSDYASRRAVMQQYLAAGLSTADTEALLEAARGRERARQFATSRTAGSRPIRYKFADRIDDAVRKVPGLRGPARRAVVWMTRQWRRAP